MSGMAPFVAGVLRDKTVSDLIEENDKLKTYIQKHSLLQVTGKCGQPVYWEHSLRHANGTVKRLTESMLDGDSDNCDILFESDECHFPLDESLFDTEVWMGGILLRQSEGDIELDTGWYRPPRDERDKQSLFSLIDEGGICIETRLFYSHTFCKEDDEVLVDAHHPFFSLLRDKYDELYRAELAEAPTHHHTNIKVRLWRHYAIEIASELTDGTDGVYFFKGFRMTMDNATFLGFAKRLHIPSLHIPPTMERHTSQEAQLLQLFLVKLTGIHGNTEHGGLGDVRKYTEQTVRNQTQIGNLPRSLYSDPEFVRQYNNCIGDESTTNVNEVLCRSGVLSLPNPHSIILTMRSNGDAIPVHKFKYLEVYLGGILVASDTQNARVVTNETDNVEFRWHDDDRIVLGLVFTPTTLTAHDRNALHERTVRELPGLAAARGLTLTIRGIVLSKDKIQSMLDVAEDYASLAGDSRRG